MPASLSLNGTPYSSEGADPGTAVDACLAARVAGYAPDDTTSRSKGQDRRETLTRVVTVRFENSLLDSLPKDFLGAIEGRVIYKLG